MMVDGLVKSLKKLFSVIPAPYKVRGKLRQESSLLSYLEILSVSSRNDWIPVPRLRASRTRFTGMTTFYEFIMVYISPRPIMTEPGWTRLTGGDIQDIIFLLIEMEEILYLENPNLKKPILVIGFEGWPNAAEVSSAALQYLVEKLEAKKFASIP